MSDAEQESAGGSGFCEEDLEEQLREYLQDREKIRSIVGQIGGVPQKGARMINAAMLLIIAALFVWALFVQDKKNLPMEAAILLVSIKLIILLHQLARSSHFQFWMLSTLEWRLNALSRDLQNLQKTVGDGGADAPAGDG